LRDFGTVRVLELDPDLGRDLSGRDMLAANKAVLAHSRLASPGPWPPGHQTVPADEPAALLLIRGLICCRRCIGGRRSADLIGSGDLMWWTPPVDDRDAVVSGSVTWRVLEPSWLASLDAAFWRRVAPWPEVLSRLLGRGMRTSRSLAVRLAIAQEPKLSARLLLLFWHLADARGQVTPNGVMLPLPVSHQTLGELVCAQRPSVSLALRNLHTRGLVHRVPGYGWRLPGNPPAELELLLRREQPIPLSAA
jgi:CRP/FNR family transcriptional regulator, cyclic AMP receptor protein